MISLSSNFFNLKKKDEKTVIILVVVIVLAGLALRLAGGRVLLPWVSGNAVGIDVFFEYDDDGDGVADGSDSITVEELGLITFRPLQIIDPLGRSVLSAEFRLKGKVDWDGEPVGYEWSGFLSVYRDNQLVDQVAVTNPNTLRKGMYSELATTGSVSKTRLEQWSGSYGSHTFRMDGDVQIKIDFQDGSSDSKSGTTSVNWNIDYQPDPVTNLSSITSFRITTYVVPLT